MELPRIMERDGISWACILLLIAGWFLEEYSLNVLSLMEFLIFFANVIATPMLSYVLRPKNVVCTIMESVIMILLNEMVIKLFMHFTGGNHAKDHKGLFIEMAIVSLIYANVVGKVAGGRITTRRVLGTILFMLWIGNVSFRVLQYMYLRECSWMNREKLGRVTPEMSGDEDSINVLVDMYMKESSCSEKAEKIVEKFIVPIFNGLQNDGVNKCICIVDGTTNQMRYSYRDNAMFVPVHRGLDEPTDMEFRKAFTVFAVGGKSYVDLHILLKSILGPVGGLVIVMVMRRISRSIDETIERSSSSSERRRTRRKMFVRYLATYLVIGSVVGLVSNVVFSGIVYYCHERGAKELVDNWMNKKNSVSCDSFFDPQDYTR